MTAATLRGATPSQTPPAAPSAPQAARRLVCFPTDVTSPNNFGLIRLALAVLVIFCHSFGMATSGGHDPLSRWSRSQMDSGALAVDWFFAISGFLIASSWMQTGTFGAYLRKRALRIFPGFAAAVLFCILLVGPLGGAHLATYFRDPQTYRFGQILLLRDVGTSVNNLPGVFQANFNGRTVDSSLWTIRYEFSCYLLIPLLAACGLLRRRWLLLTLFLSLLAAFHHFAGGFTVHDIGRMHLPRPSTLDQIPRLVLFFLAGVTFYAWRERIPRSPLLLILAVATVVFSKGHDAISERLNLTMPLAGTYVIFYVAYAKSLLPALTRLTQKHDLSYGVYLFAWPVQQLLVHYAQIAHVGVVLTPAGLFFSAVPPTLGLALLSWNLIERPCLKLKTARRAQAVPAPVVVQNAPAVAAA